MKLAIAIMHAAFDASRTETLGTLLERLGPIPAGCQLHIRRDFERVGAWRVARDCWQFGLAIDADWIIVMNDDALPCEGFVEAAQKALAARDPRDPVCFFTAHADAKQAADANAAWYTTHGGIVGVACALSRQACQEFLAWHDANLTEDFTDDGRINLWAMATRRLVYTTVPSLVDHQLPEESLVGNAHHEARRAVVPPTNPPPDLWTMTRRCETCQGTGTCAVSALCEDEECPVSVLCDDCEGRGKQPLPIPHLGRQYIGNHWELIFRTRPASWDLEASYLVERDGVPISDTPRVFIATPAYQPPELAHLESVSRVVADLADHGIEVIHYMSGGDSLVTRGRHCIMHEFMRSNATHLLQWDADIECLDVTAVRRMVETGHGIVGGAYPFRDGSGRVVLNPLAADAAEKRVHFEGQCFRVADIGTGFLLTRRDVIVDLMKRHPELLYEADMPIYVGVPMWALFDVALEPKANGRQRYASEDWRFCSLAREAGYDVWCYFPPKFRHWGKTGHAGHVAEAWKLEAVA